MNNITSFDLQKIMVRAYQCPDIPTALVDMIYDYFNRTCGVKKITYNDEKKFIDIIPGEGADKIRIIADLRNMYGSFVFNVLKIKEYEYVLSKESSYQITKNMADADLYYLAVGTSNILDLSIDNDIVIRVNLIN